MSEALALSGSYGRALSLCSKVFVDAAEIGTLIGICEAAISCGLVYDLGGHYSGGILVLREGLAAAVSLGDEPRRAKLSLLLARLLAYKHQFDEAALLLAATEIICTKFGLHELNDEALATRGLFCTERGDLAEAFAILYPLAQRLSNKVDSPLYARVSLGAASEGTLDQPEIVVGGPRQVTFVRVVIDLMLPAVGSGDDDALQWAINQIETAVYDKLFGLRPYYYLTFIYCVLQSSSTGFKNLASKYLKYAAEDGKISKNEYIKQEVQRLTPHVKALR